jgi:hypothetical protein
LHDVDDRAPRPQGGRCDREQDLGRAAPHQVDVASSWIKPGDCASC